MGWLTNALFSSVGRKIIMSLTGIFLILFLTEHLISNFLLLKDDGGLAFNEFAHFMKHNSLILIGEVVLFVGFIFHIIDGIVLVNSNRAARPVAYAVANKSKLNSWTSKYMGPFGIVLLIFLILHLYNFFRYKYFAPIENVPGTDIADMASKVYLVFQNPLEVGIYIIAMFVLAFHLWHGFQSAFRTLGLGHVKYLPFIQLLGKAYSILIPAGMALIPIVIYLKHLSN